MAREELSMREIDALIAQIEKRVDLLKQDYERYFIGVDRRPPTVLHQQVVREVLELDHMYISNTAQKFRTRSLVQRFNTLKTYWNRTLRQIEEGTYHRDRSRAERRQERRQAREDRSEEGAYELDLEADLLDLENVDLEEVFNDPREPGIASSQSPGELSEEEKERIKQVRLAELQRQLGILPDASPQSSAPQSAPVHQQPSRIQPQSQPRAPQAQAAQSGPSAPQEPPPREDKLAAMRARLQDRTGRAAAIPKSAPQPTAQGGPSPSTGSNDFSDRDDSRAAKLSRLRSNLQREGTGPSSSEAPSGPQRVVQRSTSSRPSSPSTSPSPAANPVRSSGSHRVVKRTSGNDDDAARRVYNNLIEAKRRCNERTDNLSYDTVKRSMDKQRAQFQQKGARGVDFQVVIKDGKAFLKPDPKE